MNISKEFMKALSWIAIFLSITLWINQIISILFIDFIHGNPHISKENAIYMILFEAPILSLIAFIGVFIVFIFAQCLQAIFTKTLLDRFGFRGVYSSIIFVPVTTIITWYSYDYLTPPNLGINEGAFPYHHGLTVQRYFLILAMQTFVTLFTLLFFGLKASSRRNARKMLILALLAAAPILGSIWGYETARGQFQYL